MIIYNGATGSLGRYLASAAASAGLRSHALAARLEDVGGLESELAQVDDSGTVTFIHLAARVAVPECEANPALARAVNVDLAGETCRAVARWAQIRQSALRIVYVSTGHVYAAPALGERVAEASATAPASVYAQTKLDAEKRLARLFEGQDTPLLISRVFGLVGPDQPRAYVLPGLIRRALERNFNQIPGLAYVRDYLDARDVCDGLIRLSEHKWPSFPFIVNLCSGVPVSIRELMGLVLAEVCPSDAEEFLASSTPGPARPSDLPWLVGNPTRFVRTTGRHPQSIPLSKSVRDSVEKERNR